MLASILASNGFYWAVTPAGALAATATRAAASVFDLSGDGGVPTLVREVKSGRFLAVAPDGAVTVRDVAPELGGSALTVEPASLAYDAPRAFRAPDRVHWVTVHADRGGEVRADAASRGAAETFTLVQPVVSAGAPELEGSATVGGAVAGGATLLPAAGWRQCARCGLLYDENVPASARGCYDPTGAGAAQVLRGPARRRPHAPKGDVVYRVLAAKDRNARGVIFLRCNLCAALIDRGNPDRPCGAAAGGIHRYALSAGYAARPAMADPPLRPVPRWRVCAGCSALYHDDGSPTRCPADAGHTPREDVAYTLDTA